MNTIGKQLRERAAIWAMLAAVGAIAGCSSGGSRAMDVGARPLVQQSAVDAAVSEEASSLAFFDDLEARPLASQDDAIHACLLLGTGASGPSFEQRLAMATELGYVPKGYDRPARQAVTIGEVSSMIVKILEGERRSEGEALSRLVHRGIAPASAKANQGLTGAQLVSMAGGVRDAMALEGVQRVSPPVVPEPLKAAAAAPIVASADSSDTPLTTKGVTLGEAAKGEQPKIVAATPTTTPSAAPGSAGASGSVQVSGAKGRGEPLPEIPVGTPPPAIELQDPNSKGSVIGPDQKVISPGGAKSDAPKPAAPASPGTSADAKKDDAKKAANTWVSGQPLKKPVSPDEPK